MMRKIMQAIMAGLGGGVMVAMALCAMPSPANAAFDGSGNFNRLYNWQADKAAGINIRADRMDAEMDGFATGLSTCITKDGQTQPSANLPMNGYRLTGMGLAVDGTQPTIASQVRDGGLMTGTTGGSANAYTLTRSIPASSLVTGTVVWLKIPAANTDSSTLNVDALGAKKIYKGGTVELVAGDLVSGTVHALMYDGTAWQLDGVQGNISASVVTATNISVTNITATNGLLPVGSIVPFAGPSTSVPAGWLVAAGQSVSRTGVYANLYAVLGTTYGTADSDSFNLPDLRGRVVAGMDNMNGTAAGRLSSSTIIAGSTLGATGGDQYMQAHTHANTLTDPGHTHNMNAGTSGGGSTGLTEGTWAGVHTLSTNNVTTGITITNASSGSGNGQNVQPTIILNWIIKY